DLEISGGVMSFPVYIKGHTSGVDVFWFRKGATGSFSGHDAELFRRASHAIANARTRNLTPDKNDAIGFALEIANLFLGDPKPAVRQGDLNKLGKECAEHIAPYL